MSNRKIMVIGDLQPRLERIISIFTNRSYEVIRQRDINLAKRTLEEKQIDLIIINTKDYVVDEMEFVKKIREDYEKDLTLIIVISDNLDMDQKLKFLELGADEYLNYPFDARELFFRMENLMKRVFKNRDVNPLSGLSGNNEIHQQISSKIHSGADFVVLYCDLDNFKVYNDIYGFNNGDKVIKTVGDILKQSVLSPDGVPQGFVGHIGGDDFVVVTSIERADSIGNFIVSEFEKIKPDFYNPQDRNNGYVIGKTREEEERKFPLMSISVAGVTTKTRILICTAQVAEIAAEVKKYAKSLSGSNYVEDRRQKENGTSNNG